MSITLQHPLPSGKPTDPFGPRGSVPGLGDLGFHNGQDYAAPEGTEIKAAHAGTISFYGWDSAGGGWMIRVEASGYATCYAHMRELPANLGLGSKVKAGQVIGYVGQTGAATGPHLHFILVLGNGSNAVNPVPYIKTKKPTIAKGKKEVIPYHRQDKDARAKGRTIAPGGHIYLNTKSGGPSNAANVIGTVGEYSITPHLYAEGAPGDALDLALIWQDSKKGPSSNSRHYTVRAVFDKNGLLRISPEFKRAVPKGYRVFVRVDAPASNAKSAKVTLLDSDAYAFVA